MKGKPYLAPALLATFLCGNALAQADKLVETIEVRVANIEVIVVDDEGRHVEGLKPDDFRVLENGEPQTITNFAEFKAERAPVDETGPAVSPVVGQEAGRRYIQVFIDDESADPRYRSDVLLGVRRVLEEILTEGDEVSIARWMKRFKLELEYTNDVEEVTRTLERLAEEEPLATSFASQRREVARRIDAAVGLGQAIGYGAAYRDALQLARFYAEELRANFRDLTENLETTIAAMGGLAGRKVLIFVGESFPRYPGMDMFELADRAFEPHIGRAADSKREALQRSESPSIEALTVAANANGVSFYAFTSGSLASSGKGAESSSAPLGFASVEAITFQNTAGALLQIADGTGGVAGLNANALPASLKRLAGDLTSYYSIGYRPSADGADTRSIEVLVNVPDATVRTRNQLVLKSTDEELSSRILSCLFRETCHGEFPIEASAGKPTKARRNRRKVPVEVRVPLVGLTLLPRDQSMVGGMYIHIAAVDEDGGFSDVSTQHHRVTVPISDGDDMKDKHVTWAAEILVERGTRDVAISVTDEVSLRSGYGKVKLRGE